MKPLAKSEAGPPKKRRPIRVAVFGATGYAGVELLRILVQHPRIKLTVLTSQHFSGKRVCEVYPSLVGKCDLVLEEIQMERMAPRFDLAFAALPHETSMDLVATLIGGDKRVIDLSADFRLRDPESYCRWYRPHKAPHLLRTAIYGLTEIHREKIARASLVANPGCYPTGKAMGEREIIPPIIALWLPNLVLGLIATYFFRKALKESPPVIQEKLQKIFRSLIRRLSPRQRKVF